MAIFHIPSRHIAVFDIISTLSRAEAETFAQTLNQVPIGYGPEHAAEYVVDTLGKDPSDLSSFESIASVIYSMLHLAFSEKLELDEIIADAVAVYESEREGLSEEKKELLIENLRSLAGTNKVAKFTVKALSLQIENERRFSSAKILSDVRIVFDDDLNNENPNAIINHILRLRYIEDDERKNMFIALDTDDLSDLRDVINRAIEKDDILRNNKISKLSYIPTGKLD